VFGQALVADGHAADSLLDTYETERLPAGVNTLGFTNKLFQWSTMRHPVKRAVRDVLVPAATHLPTVQRRAARRLSQVSVSYPASPLVQADGGRREPKPGHRFPDVEVRTEKGTTRLHRVLGGGRHVLLLSSAEARVALDSTGPGPCPWLVDVVEGCAGARDGFALVRPDGVLAARGSGKDVHRITTYLHQLCGASPVRTVSCSPEETS